ncbi:MAG TPA: exodeoxyribonuclease I, partial [Cellvibrionaceae bacterium]|nr:exodeoxyribonuclease I [Cellvibrionaceae bacterium]
MHTLYWHDYETWGIDPSIDRPCQFAGVRTDEDLNIIEEPLRLYCQPAIDILPNPEACLVTGIAPQKAQQEGLIEAEFIAAIHGALAVPGTCGVGYNSLRFDDEVTRFTLYRNFYDPYEREWKNGNSRWDILDMLRLVHALKPDTLNWPEWEGRVSFKLELLTKANGIEHGAAHDAYSDVAATIALAKLIKTRQPKLYDYCYNLRLKHNVSAHIDLIQKKPLLHISSKFPIEQGNAALVMPLCYHPVNKNAVLVVNLAQDPQQWIHLSAEELAARLFTTQTEDSPPRPSIKAIHLNKSPIVATPKLLDAQTQARLKIDKQQCEIHWQQLIKLDLTEKLQAAFSINTFAPREDPERKLYDGFLPNGDMQLAKALRTAKPEEITAEQFCFSDKRLQAMLLRYKARNFPHALTEREQQQWFEFCHGRLSDGEPGILSCDQLKMRIRTIDETQALTKEQKIVLQQLYRYVEDVAVTF